MTVKNLFTDLAKDLLVAPPAGYVGTTVMERVNMALYQREHEADRAREDAVRPGPPFRIAAGKALRLVKVKLDDAQLDRACTALHSILPATRREKAAGQRCRQRDLPL